MNAPAVPALLSRQRGAAILTAMLTVVLVATLAAATMWQQWRGVEIEAAERSRVQSAWILTGALDWARLILREDARKGGADHLAEPWAVPLEQARLSTFLAADRNDVQIGEDAQDAFLSGQIIDLQSRLNMANLMQGARIDEASWLAMTRLFELLNLPTSELTAMGEGLKRARDPKAQDADKGEASLWPGTIDQLAWLGLSARTIEALRPFVTLLPVRTPVNLNTAEAEVIYATVSAYEIDDAQRLVRARSTKHFGSLSDATKAGSKGAATAANPFNEAQHSVNSRFFEVRGALKVQDAVVQEVSVVQRDGLAVKILSRQRGVASATAPLQ